MKILFAGIPLDKMSVSMTMNGAVLPVLAISSSPGEEQGVSPDKLSGTIQNDILKEFMVRNTYIYPPEPSMRIVADIIDYTAKQHAEIQFDLDLAAITCRKRARPRCRSSPSRWPTGSNMCAPRWHAAWTSTTSRRGCRFFFGIGMNFFMEVAKLRAARLLWARASWRSSARRIRESLMLRTHCQTSGVSLTEQDPYNNIVRTTFEALAAVLGRHAIAAHQFLRRGHRAAHRVLRPHRAQHPADPAA